MFLSLRLCLTRKGLCCASNWPALVHASVWGFGVCVADDLASDKKVLCVLANFDREDCLVSIPGDVKETFRDDAILIKKSRVLRTCRKDDEYSVLDKETMDIN